MATAQGGSLGLIMAAGRSSRMGQPKALLRWQNSSFLEHLLGQFVKTGFDQIVVTLPDQVPDLLEIARQYPVIIGANPWPELSMSGSIRWCLNHCPEAKSLVICPVDMPFVSVELLNLLRYGLEAATKPRICIPQFHGRRGHPIGFTDDFFLELMAAKGRGPADLIKKYPHFVNAFPWHDARILSSINTVEDYNFWTTQLC